FTKRLLEEKSAGTVKTERDAVILVDKKAGGGTLRLHYLVSAAAWKPQYKFRSAGKEKDPVVVEYLAAIEQKTGEDWTNAQITLSTAQPLLNAAPPDLKTLAVAVSPAGAAVATSGGGRVPAQPVAGPGGIGGGYAGPGVLNMPNPSALQKDLQKQSQELRGQ